MAKEQNCYYVYVASIWEEVVYVGMGCKDRISHVNSGCSHNSDLNRLYFLHGHIEVYKYRTGMSKKQALAEELRLISMYIPLCNKAGNPLGMYGNDSVKKYSKESVQAFYLGVCDYVGEKASPTTKRKASTIKEIASLLIHLTGNPCNMLTKEFDLALPHVKSKLRGAFPKRFGQPQNEWNFLEDIIFVSDVPKGASGIYLKTTEQFREWYSGWYKYCFKYSDADIISKLLPEIYEMGKK